MSNIYDVFEQRKESISMLEEGFGYIEPDEDVDFDTIEEGMDVLDEISQDLSNETIKYCAESLVTDMVLEEALYEDYEDFVEGDYLSEAIKEKAGKAKDMLMDKWKQFKAWVRKIIESIKNFFLNGEQLFNKYNDIPKRLQSCTKEVKCHDYAPAATAIENCNKMVEKIKLAAFNQEINAGQENYKEKCYNILGIKDKSSLNEKVKKEFITSSEPTTKPIHRLNIGVVVNYAANKKDIINGIKKFESRVDAEFKEVQNLIKLDIAGKSRKEAKETGSKNVLKAFNFLFGIKSSIINSMIGCVKSISKNCLAICKKAIGGDVTAEEARKKADKRAEKNERNYDKKEAKERKKEWKKEFKNAKKNKWRSNKEAFDISFEDDDFDDSYNESYDDYDYSYEDDDYSYDNYDYSYDNDDFDW